MAQAKAKTSTHDHPFDVLSARLSQARGAVLAIKIQCGDPRGSLTEGFLSDALWAVEELLRQAICAFDELSPATGTAIEKRVIQ